jgi:hypothetical protein
MVAVLAIPLFSSFTLFDSPDCLFFIDSSLFASGDKPASLTDFAHQSTPRYFFAETPQQLLLGFTLF